MGPGFRPRLGSLLSASSAAAQIPSRPTDFSRVRSSFSSFLEIKGRTSALVLRSDREKPARRAGVRCPGFRLMTSYPRWRESTREGPALSCGTRGVRPACGHQHEERRGLVFTEGNSEKRRNDQWTKSLIPRKQ